MRKSGSFVVLVTLIIFIIVIWMSQKESKEVVIQESISVKQLTLKSSAFENNTLIPVDYTCDGVNINPPLEISGVEEKAKSLVLIMDDPDTLSTWVHWVVWNIAPNITTIPEGTSGIGVSGQGSGGIRSFQGSCPPSGTHHYHFKLYSLDNELDIPKGSKKKDVEMAIKGHVLQQAQLIGLYKRK